MYAPVTEFAVRLVPPAASTSGSEVGRIDLLDRHGRAVADRALVSRRGDDGDMTGGGVLQRRVDGRHLRAGPGVLTQVEVLTDAALGDHLCVADGDPHIRGERGGELGRGAHVRRVDQNLADGGVGGDGVHQLGVLHLLQAGQPRRGGRARQGRGDLDPCRGQAEPVVEVRYVLPDVSDRRGPRPCRRGAARRSRFGLLGQRHRDAAAVDPAIQQRLDAVGDPELVGCITRRPEARQSAGTAPGGLAAAGAMAPPVPVLPAGSRCSAGVISPRRGAVAVRLPADAEALRWIGVGEVRHAVGLHALRIGKIRPVGRRLCRGRAAGGRRTAAARRQHGDGCYDSQGCRTPRAPATTGLVVHRGSLRDCSPCEPFVQNGR